MDFPIQSDTIRIGLSIVPFTPYVVFFKKIFLHFNRAENIMENGTFALRANVPFFITFLKILHFKGIKRHLCGVKG